MQGIGAGIGPVFILKTHNQTNYKCLPKLVRPNIASVCNGHFIFTTQVFTNLFFCPVMFLNLVSSRITSSGEQFNKLRLTISALSAFKPRATSITIPSNHADDGPSNHICHSQCDCDTKQHDAIDKVAKAQQVSHGGRKTPEKRKKEIAEGHNGNTRRKSVPAGNKNRKVRLLWLSL